MSETANPEPLPEIPRELRAQFARLIKSGPSIAPTNEVEAEELEQMEEEISPTAVAIDWRNEGKFALLARAMWSRRF